MFETISLTLSEDPSKYWAFKLRCVPPQISKIRHLTILNQSEPKTGHLYKETISRKDSYRIQRWNLLEEAAKKSGREFVKSAFLFGSQFNWDVKLSTDQLVSFRWRHAVPLSVAPLTKILTTNAGSLRHLEISMIQPMSHQEVRRLDTDLASGRAPSQIRSLTYRGLSHTEPLLVNNPERGGRFRMLRPIFKHIRHQIEELRLSQDHCISQVGKTPMFLNGRGHQDYLCELTELVYDPTVSETDLPAFVILNLLTLELGGFQVDRVLTPTNPIQLNLSKLRHLTLNDCNGLEDLFSGLITQSGELNLKSLALRYYESTDYADTADEVVSRLQTFLESFEGLEILSILWQGDLFPPQSFDGVLKKHSGTLQVLVTDLRYFDEARIVSHTGGFITMPRMETNILGLHTMPNVKEFAFNLMHNVKNASEVHRLRMLSAYDSLRTVHIRNFPPTQKLLGNPGEHSFWRSPTARLGIGMVEVAETFAELIARPFYEVPSTWDVSDGLREDLKSLSESHMEKRGKQLFGCDKPPKLKYNSATPVKDLTKNVVEERVKVNRDFAALDAKIDSSTASEDEAKEYLAIVGKIRTILGVNQPDITEKPKLRLLIIGDWTYRDQMNITGPRNYDPRAWCDRKVSINSDEDDSDTVSNGEESEEDEDYEDPDRDLLEREFEFPYHFKHQWDACVRPIFFEIDWTASKDVNGRYRWKACAKALPHKTLEGRRALSDVRSLEYAWAA